MSQSITTKQIRRALTTANYNLIFKWYSDKKIIIDIEFRSIVENTIDIVIQTSKQKNDMRLYYFLFELLGDIVPFVPEFMLQLCQDPNSFDKVKWYVRKFPTEFMMKNIIDVPANVQDLFISKMTKETLDLCLQETFESSWNNDRHIGLLEKLLKAGANPNFYETRCGTHPFERATSLAQAKLFLKYGTKIDKKRLFDQVMYAIIWDTAVDMRHVYNEKDRTKYHDRDEFILSRVCYKYVPHGDEESSDNDDSDDEDNDDNDDNDGNYDNSEYFDKAIRFFEENGIKFKRYGGCLSNRLNKLLTELNIDITKCKLESEFIKVKYTFPKQDDYDVTNNIVAPGTLNYWCWLDHLESDPIFLIGKWNLVNRSLRSLCADKIREFGKEEETKSLISKEMYEKCFINE